PCPCAPVRPVVIVGHERSRVPRVRARPGRGVPGAAAPGRGRVPDVRRMRGRLGAGPGHRPGLRRGPARLPAGPGPAAVAGGPGAGAGLAGGGCPGGGGPAGGRGLSPPPWPELGGQGAAGRSEWPRGRSGAIRSRTTRLSTAATVKSASVSRGQIGSPSSRTWKTPPVPGTSPTALRSASKVVSSSWAIHVARGSQRHRVQYSISSRGFFSWSDTGPVCRAGGAGSLRGGVGCGDRVRAAAPVRRHRQAGRGFEPAARAGARGRRLAERGRRAGEREERLCGRGALLG